MIEIPDDLALAERHIARTRQRLDGKPAASVT